MSQSKKQFKKFVEKIENEVVKKLKEKDDFENVMHQMLVKMNSFFAGSFVRVLETFHETNKKKIKFNVKFDFTIIKKNINEDFTNFDIKASAESNIDDDKLKIEDFIK